MKLGSAVFVRKTTAILVLSIMLFGSVSLVSPFSGLHSLLPRIQSAHAATTTNLGFDCAYGSNTEGAVFPTSVTTSAPYSAPDFDLTLDRSCQATYLADLELPSTLHPLVSDNPTAVVTPGSGGGLTIDVVAQLNATTTMSAFDIRVKYDATVLNAVIIDQSGLIWGGAGLPTGAFVLTLASTIDHVAGIVRLAQVLVGTTQQGGASELFRIRFDVVGASIGTPITFFDDVLANPSVIAHNDLNIDTPGVDTRSIYNILNPGTALNLVANWTFTPTPQVPGSQLTFTAMATCPGCMGPLNYRWDFSSNDAPMYVRKSQATTNPAMITPPLPIVNRVTLTINDSATPQHSMAITRLLPLVSKANPSLTTLAVGTASGAWLGQWLGGLTTGSSGSTSGTTSGYTGGWTFCPGSALVKTVCSVPSGSFTQTGIAINETTHMGPEIYHFAGLYNATLKVADTPETQIGTTPLGNVALVNFLNNVTGAPAAYTVSVFANATSPFIGQNVNFTAAVAYDSTYPANFQATIFNYVFNFGDGTPPVTTLGGKTVIVFHNFTASGNFAVRAVAKETGSRAVSQIVEQGFINVSPLPILCKLAGSCGFTISTPSIVSGASVTFTATVSGGTTPYYVTWNFGDGSTVTGQTVNHTYQSAGTYTVTLMVTDSSGQTQVLKKTITVAPGPTNLFSLALVLAGIAVAAVIVALAAILMFARRRRALRQPKPSLGSR